MTAGPVAEPNWRDDDMHDMDEASLRGLFARATIGEEPPLGSLIDDARRTAIMMRRRRCWPPESRCLAR